MRASVRRNARGQTALFDGLLFFVIMIVASVLVLVTSTTGFQERRVASGKDLVVLGHEYRDAFFSSTLPRVTYLDKAGSTLTLYNHTVLDLLLEELSLIDDGVPSGNFEGLGSVNEGIVSLGERLIGEQRLLFSVFAIFGTHSLELYPSAVQGRSEIPFDRTTSGVAASMTIVGKPGEATVELYLWA